VFALIALRRVFVTGRNRLKGSKVWLFAPPPSAMAYGAIAPQREASPVARVGIQTLALVSSCLAVAVLSATYLRCELCWSVKRPCGPPEAEGAQRRGM
jgi:hypothetical protein